MDNYILNINFNTAIKNEEDVNVGNMSASYDGNSGQIYFNKAIYNYDEYKKKETDYDENFKTFEEKVFNVINTIKELI